MQVALVDFGHTLADETFMRRDCEEFPTWTTDYVEVVDRQAEAWNTGRLSTWQIAEEVAARLGATSNDVHAYLSRVAGDCLLIAPGWRRPWSRASSSP